MIIPVSVFYKISKIFIPTKIEKPFFKRGSEMKITKEEAEEACEYNYDDDNEYDIDSDIDITINNEEESCDFLFYE